jgi:hypothetical protein
LVHHLRALQLGYLILPSQASPQATSGDCAFLLSFTSHEKKENLKIETIIFFEAFIFLNYAQ